MDSIDTLEAGRELDAVIHEDVMGKSYRVVQPDRMGDGETYFDPVRDKYTEAEGGDIVYDLKDVGRVLRVPDYSTDIAAAWKVVGKMRDVGAYLFLENDSSKGKRWDASFEVGVVDYHAVGSSAPLAICRAALKVPPLDVR